MAVALVLALSWMALGSAESQTTAPSSTAPTSTTKPPTPSSATSSTKPATPSTSVIERAAGGGPPIPLAAAPLITVDQPRSARALASLGVESAAYDDAVASYNRSIDEYRAATTEVPVADSHIQGALDRQKRATEQFNARVQEIADLLAARTRVEGELTSAARRRDKADAQLTEIRTNLRDMAVNEYMAGGFGGAPEGIFDLANANQLGSRKVLLGLVKRDRMSELAAIVTFHDENERLAIERQAELDDLTRRIGAAEAARDQAVRDRDNAVTDEQRGRDEKVRAEQTVLDRTHDIDDRRGDVAEARLSAAVPQTGLPFVVLNAYVLASEKMAAEQPTCRISWFALAGIGRTESNHGTFGGAVVGPDGVESKPIYGIPLDGSNGTANIGDTDGGAIDNDAGTDRAAGPMQFIPSSWKSLGRDGNGDGKNDPQNYYDATMSAANLLCRAGPMDTDDGMRRAFRSYNNDGNYVETVLQRAHDYSRFVFPPADSATDPAKTVDGLTVPSS